MINKLWILVFTALPLSGIAYVLWRTWQILPLPNISKAAILAVILLCVLLFFANFGIFSLDRWPLPLAAASYDIGTSSIMILIYAVLLYLCSTWPCPAPCAPLLCHPQLEGHAHRAAGAYLRLHLWLPALYAQGAPTHRIRPSSHCPKR
jgi:hypothetical protein